jgi:hypothetical protein
MLLPLLPLLHLLLPALFVLLALLVPALSAAGVGATSDKPRLATAPCRSILRATACVAETLDVSSVLITAAMSITAE